MTDDLVAPALRPGATGACLLLLGWVVAGLSGCGGGGGSAPTPPPPPPAFALDSIQPADAASGVARNAVITANFNASPDAASVNTANVTLFGPGNNVIPAAVAVNGATVEVRAKAGALPADTTYTLTLAAAIKDGSGRSLSQAVTRTFSTASASWSAKASDLTPRSDNTGGTRPIVHTDAAGRTTAAWLDRTAVSASVLYAARLDRISGSWSLPVPVATESQGVLVGIGLAAGPGGDIFLTWARTPFGSATPGIQFSRYALSSNSWSAPVDVNAAPADGFGVGQVVPVNDAAGNITLLHSNSQSIFAARLDAATGAWKVPRRIDYPRPSNYIYQVRAAADDQGNLIAAWMQLDQDDQRALYAARYDIATGEWAPAQRVASTPPNGAEPFALAVDRTGVATIAWTLSGGIAGTTTLWASRLDAQGNTWSSAARVDRANDGVVGLGVMLVVDGAGTVTAAWSQGAKGLRTARWARGAMGWADYGVIAPDGVPVDNGAEALLTDAAGNLLLVGVASQEIYAARYLATTSRWQSPVIISAPSTGTGVFVNPPAVSMDGTGDVVALWFAQNQLATATQHVLSFNRLR